MRLVKFASLSYKTRGNTKPSHGHRRYYARRFSLVSYISFFFNESKQNGDFKIQQSVLKSRFHLGGMGYGVARVCAKCFSFRNCRVILAGRTMW